MSNLRESINQPTCRKPAPIYIKFQPYFADDAEFYRLDGSDFTFPLEEMHGPKSSWEIKKKPKNRKMLYVERNYQVFQGTSMKSLTGPRSEPRTNAPRTSNLIQLDGSRFLPGSLSFYLRSSFTGFICRVFFFCFLPLRRASCCEKMTLTTSWYLRPQESEKAKHRHSTPDV